jgi:alpha-L-fucosidase
LLVCWIAGLPDCWIAGLPGTQFASLPFILVLYAMQPIATTMKKLALLIILIAAFQSGAAQETQKKETKEQRDLRMEWWRDATFGMFIHWGLYAIPAGEYNGNAIPDIGEWIMENAKIPIPEYEKYAAQFNPKLFNAKEWVAVAVHAGVQYIVITTKHHDGFCLWDSKVTTYDVMDASPFKRDIIRELTNECKKAGIQIGFYHSIMDWHQPDAKSAKYPHQQTEKPDWNKYRETYLKPQLKELITNYNPAILWFDGEWIDEWTEEQGKDLYAYLRTLKPDLIINNRIGKGRKGMNGMNAYEDAAGDFGTPEQEILQGTSTYDWESCMTMNDTWGFKKNDQNWKSAHDLLFNLVDITAKGGNYLLNIGPKADGTIPIESRDRLREMGDWLAINGEAIYATTSLKNYGEQKVRYTKSRDGKYVYIIFFEGVGEQLRLKNLEIPDGAKMTMLGGKRSMKWKREEGSIVIDVPGANEFKYADVIKVAIK